MFKSASSQQCLDSFLDSDGKYKVHTYNCDVNNGNQKWIVHSDTKQIEHATHKGQGLDGDPTYADHHLQMWECGNNNPNQQWNLTYLLAALVAVKAQTSGTCNQDVLNAFNKCGSFVAPGGMYSQAVGIIGSTPGHLSICYGDWPECNDLQKLGLSPAGDCTINTWKGQWTNVRTIISPCPDPLPPRLVEKQLCTANKLIVSEFYGQLYTDVVHNNDNEKFSYNQTSQNIIAKSNGQCLEAVPNKDYGLGAVKTAPCDVKSVNQKWFFDGNRVRIDGYCLKTDPFTHGSVVSMAVCDYGNPYISNEFFADCSSVTANYVRIVSTHGKRV
ncbi:hypothetical protein THRCLA_07867, partial [Thraustotheca clavata]